MMDTKDTAETTKPSVAAAKPVPEPTCASEPYPETVPLVTLTGIKHKDDSLDLSGLGAAFGELRPGTLEGKEKEKGKA